MPYEKFNTLESTAVPMPMENVDTDQIIPARFLKATERKDFGDNLFRDWRYNTDGSPKENFVLNNPIYKGKILVGGKNFGSGSSREHAGWAIYDHGFRCVVSSFFADIFQNNCLNLGILPVQVSEDFLKEIFLSLEKDPKAMFTVDISKQTITNQTSGNSESFEINDYKKNNMINGYDDIDYLQSLKSEIKEFASQSPY